MAGFISAPMRIFGNRVPAKNRIVATTSIWVFDGDRNEIGYITDINYDTTRRWERIRHLNAIDAGAILEQVPGPEDYTLTVNGFALYHTGEQPEGSLIHQIAREVGYDGEAIFQALNEQAELFDIVVQDKHPNPQAPNAKTYARYFLNCAMTRFSEPISTRNVHIVSTATLQPSWVSYEVL
jgi:hypothetical protein